MGGAAVEDEKAGHLWLRAAIAAIATSRTATRILRIRIGRVGARAGLL
jgi:hypothetical protein